MTDKRYEALARRLGELEQLSTPTLLIQGALDHCDAPKEPEGQDKFFTGGYQRLLLEGIGHFPHREAPDAVADAIVRLLERHS